MPLRVGAEGEDQLPDPDALTLLLHQVGRDHGVTAVDPPARRFGTVEDLDHAVPARGASGVARVVPTARSSTTIRFRVLRNSSVSPGSSRKSDQRECPGSSRSAGRSGRTIVVVAASIPRPVAGSHHEGTTNESSSNSEVERARVDLGPGGHLEDALEPDPLLAHETPRPVHLGRVRHRADRLDVRRAESDLVVPHDDVAAVEGEVDEPIGAPLGVGVVLGVLDQLVDEVRVLAVDLFRQHLEHVGVALIQFRGRARAVRDSGRPSFSMQLRASVRCHQCHSESESAEAERRCSQPRVGQGEVSVGHRGVGTPTA